MPRPAGALLHNWRLKLSALGLAIFLWTLVQTEPRSSETFGPVPILVELADTAWALAGAPNPVVAELELSGPAREIIRLARTGTTVRVPLTSIGSRDTLITLRRDWVELGEGTALTVESVSPANISVSLEPALTVTLPVAVRVRGEIPGRLALASAITVNPRMVTLRGPASRLAQLDSLPLVPFDLASVGQSGMFTVQLDTAGLVGSTIVPSTAALGIRVEDHIERVLVGIPVQADTDDGEIAVVVDPIAVEVRLSGARTLVTSVEPDLLRVWVQPDLLRGMTDGEERRVPIRVDGVPALVSAATGVDLVTVRRAADQASGPRGGT